MLRQELEKITEEPDLDIQQELIEKLRNACPHNIQFMDSDFPLERYTCIVHALGLVGNEKYGAIAKFERDRNGCPVYAGTEFIRYLLDRNLLINKAQPEKNDIAIYFEYDDPKHAGIYIADGVIESKWGDQLLYRHFQFEVPSSYGDRISYYQPLLTDEVIEYFYDFAESKGVPFKYE